jgi:xanthine dehydrogenase molybdopterin-binding subunit B
MAAVKYGMMLMDHGMPLLLSVFANDGTITVVQGGVEMGQGLYMKVRADWLIN